MNRFADIDEYLKMRRNRPNKNKKFGISRLTTIGDFWDKIEHEDKLHIVARWNRYLPSRIAHNRSITLATLPFIELEEFDGHNSTYLQFVHDCLKAGEPWKIKKWGQPQQLD